MVHHTRSANDSAEATDSISVSLRAYLSPLHLWTARTMTQRCEELEARLMGSGLPAHPNQRSYATAAIQSSVSFLEAFVNEVYEDSWAYGHRAAPLSRVARRALAEFTPHQLEGDRGVLAKYQFVLTASGEPEMNRGTDPFQSAHLLVALRNALTHFRPVSHNEGSPSKLERRLTGRFPKSPLLGDNDGSGWSVWALAGPGARWACDSATAFVDDWCGRVGVTRLYEEAIPSFERNVEEFGP